jgi:hypothetical protein
MENKELAVNQKILLYRWASEDLIKAKELSQVDGMDKYDESLLCEHYKNSSLTLEVMQRYIIVHNLKGYSHG